MSVAVDTLVAVFFVGVLVVVSVVDVRQRIIPNRIVLPATAIVLAARTIVHPSVVWISSARGVLTRKREIRTWRIPLKGDL